MDDGGSVNWWCCTLVRDGRRVCGRVVFGRYKVGRVEVRAAVSPPPPAALATPRPTSNIIFVTRSQMSWQSIRSVGPSGENSFTLQVVPYYGETEASSGYSPPPLSSSPVQLLSPSGLCQPANTAICSNLDYSTVPRSEWQPTVSTYIKFSIGNKSLEEFHIILTKNFQEYFQHIPRISSYKSTVYVRKLGYFALDRESAQNILLFPFVPLKDIFDVLPSCSNFICFYK